MMYSVVVLSLKKGHVLEMRKREPAYANLHILVTDVESVNKALLLRGIEQIKALQIEHPIKYKRIVEGEGVRTFETLEGALEGARKLQDRYNAAGRKSLALGLRSASGVTPPGSPKAELNKFTMKPNAPEVSVKVPFLPPQTGLRPHVP